MAEKFIKHDGAGGFIETETSEVGGVGSADTIPSLDVNGQLPLTMMPTGIGGDTAVIPAVGVLAAGDYVNIFDNSGSVGVRKADASSIGTKAHGFVLTSVADGANATVFLEGSNTAVTGQTGGDVYLTTTAGLGSTTAPTGTSEIVQKLGVAVSTTAVSFEPTNPIILA